ncbi:hypothetical protein ACOME3_003115 [Neoechinorhynchus agilis]
MTHNQQRFTHHHHQQQPLEVVRQRPVQSGTMHPSLRKPMMARAVTGRVKWFNVKRGYGFVNRDDTHEDVFIHQTSIIRNNPNKYLRSVGDNEPLVFDVVKGEKGMEAANVTGPNGAPVQGSRYAADRPQREFGPRRGQLYGFYRNRAAYNGNSQTNQIQAAPMMYPPPAFVANTAAAAYFYHHLYQQGAQFNQAQLAPHYYMGIPPNQINGYQTTDEGLCISTTAPIVNDYVNSPLSTSANDSATPPLPDMPAPMVTPPSHHLNNNNTAYFTPQSRSQRGRDQQRNGLNNSHHSSGHRQSRGRGRRSRRRRYNGRGARGSAPLPGQGTQ